ncbi:hypothetical protein [Paraburkholderia sediminicola]|uniref:hypothetical protein n=1 Tax=Paraburkholderia sediminicola TaxID=458836 RepID=UPI0038BE17C8
MSHVAAQVSLRPIRFAFLVRPEDKKGTLEIFRINTCLWGGRFNPVIPYFKHTPTWWDRHSNNFATAIQIINGYLDFFEPDFLVEAEAGLASDLGFEPGRVLALSSLLVREGQGRRNGYGLSVIDLYRDLYQREYQFTRRHPHNIVDVVPPKPSLAGFCACTFGGFPSAADLTYFATAFVDAFEPIKVRLSGEELSVLYERGFTSALKLGCSSIEVTNHDQNDPALFVLDANEPRDLIDFWNLRAIGRVVVAVPVQWIQELSDFCKSFIRKHHRPLPGNPNGVMIRATVMFARSIPRSEIERLYPNYLQVEAEGANVLQDWYPAIWRPSPGYAPRITRPMLSAGERKNDIPVIDEQPHISFELLHPEFASEIGGEMRWANVVRLRDWTSRDQLATVFPCDFRNPKYPDFHIGTQRPLPTTEGLVFFPRFRNMPERWELPDGTRAVNDWLKTHGINAVLSDAGRTTQQIVQTMGGFWGVSSFAHADIVKLLNEISRRPVTRSAHNHEFKNRVNDAVKGDTWRHRNFERLVERNAVELGLELKCTKCSNWSWYSLKQLDYQVTCELCLRKFNFPVIEPSNSSKARWAYRLIGPFALPDYAQGGYAASLSVRFFSQVIGEHGHADVTWSAGQELELSVGNKIEADFILWYQRKGFLGSDYQTEVVFGESKSFGREAFQASDVERMKSLATRFPGAVIVFATMKNAAELLPVEIARIAKLAEWGREYLWDRRQTRAPVIVLTGAKLFAAAYLQVAWEGVGGKHTEFSKSPLLAAVTLRGLADLTQQLYLNMPPYHAWLTAKTAKRRARREEKASRASTGSEPNVPAGTVNQ